MQKRNRMQEGLLLLEDIRNLGRKGDIVRAKPGFAWNFLLPQKKAVIADKRTVRLQEKLKEERAKQALEDEKESRLLAGKLKDKTFTITVKTDSNGHLYGSVTTVDIVKLLSDEMEVIIERRSVLLLKPIKKTGSYSIELSLKEGVPAKFKLNVKGDAEVKPLQQQVEVIEEGEEKEEEELSSPKEELPTPDESQDSAREEIEERTKGEG